MGAKPRIPDQAAAAPDGRARIIRAAASLFRLKGFKATTVRELAEAVGMKSGSLFYFFRSKEDILLAIMDEGLVEVHTAVAEAQQGGSAEAGFRAMLQRHLEGILDRDSDHMNVMLYEMRALPTPAERQIRQLRRAYDSMWEAQIEALIQEGRWRGSGEPRLSRLALMGALNWSVQWFRPSRGDTIEGLAATLCDLFLIQAKHPQPPAGPLKSKSKVRT